MLDWEILDQEGFFCFRHTPLGLRVCWRGYPLVSHQLTGKMSMESTWMITPGSDSFSPGQKDIEM